MFKRGVKYKRDEIAQIARPENPPRGGNWTTGYDRIDDYLYVFMNMGVPGRTGHNFDNHYDPDTRTLIWFGKPNSHSGQPTFEKLMTGELKPLFFARWDQSHPFTFLGSGKVISYKDGFITGQGHQCVRVVLSIEDLREIVSDVVPEILTNKDDELGTNSQSSFALEKHLEDFMVRNWRNLPIGNQYDIFEQNGEVVGQQYRTSIGPIDILGLNKEKTDFMVFELKRDRASDVVVGQTLRYMGWVKEHLCTPTQQVSGCIIAHANDDKLNYALNQVPSIRFMRYEVDFKLIG
ncbi:MAG: endonuclease NucS domain-containing protein [Candidatus Puniceispirillaceae bacterium]